MNKKCKILVLFLLVSLCAVSTSFYVNHKRLKREVIRLRETNSSNFNSGKVFAVNLPKSVSKNKVFVSYAQVFEDLILYDVLGNVENGFYIDVGANHPTIDSVTKFFYEEGYCGINIEPLFEEYKKLLNDRSRDVNLCVCAGERDGKLCLYERGGLSTLDINIAKNGTKSPLLGKLKSFR